MASEILMNHNENSEPHANSGGALLFLVIASLQLWAIYPSASEASREVANFVTFQEGKKYINIDRVRLKHQTYKKKMTAS